MNEIGALPRRRPRGRRARGRLRRAACRCRWRGTEALALAQRGEHLRRQERRHGAVAPPTVAQARPPQAVVAGEQLLHPAPREAGQRRGLRSAPPLRQQPDHLGSAAPASPPRSRGTPPATPPRSDGLPHVPCLPPFVLLGQDSNHSIQYGNPPLASESAGTVSYHSSRKIVTSDAALAASGESPRITGTTNRHMDRADKGMILLPEYVSCRVPERAGRTLRRCCIWPGHVWWMSLG